MNKVLTILLVFLFFFSLDTYSQKRRYGMNSSKKQSAYRGGKVNHGGIAIKRYSTVGFSINAMNYFGDITPAPTRFSTDFSFTKPGFGLTYSKVFHPQAAWRAAFNYGAISGDDFKADNTTPPSQYLYLRNLHFRNRIMELSWGLEINLIPNGGGANNRFPLNPYIFLGVAIFRHNPQAKAPEFDLLGNPLPEAGQWVDLQPLKTEGQSKPYSLFQLAVPVGLGVKVRLPDNFDAHFEIGFRQLFTDHLDDVGGPYADLGTFDNELARALSERSGESISALSLQERVYEGGSITTSNWPSTDPETGDVIASYRAGQNYSPGGPRGSGALKDVYVITQLRLVYIFGHVSRKKAKFR